LSGGLPALVEPEIPERTSRRVKEPTRLVPRLLTTELLGLLLVRHRTRVKPNLGLEFAVSCVPPVLSLEQLFLKEPLLNPPVLRCLVLLVLVAPFSTELIPDVAFLSRLLSLEPRQGAELTKPVLEVLLPELVGGVSLAPRLTTQRLSLPELELALALSGSEFLALESGFLLSEAREPVGPPEPKVRPRYVLIERGVSFTPPCAELLLCEVGFLPTQPTQGSTSL